MVKDKSQTCPVCQGSGFLQQGAVWEIYPIGAEERELIAAQNWEGLRTAFRKTSLPAIGTTAIRRVAEGLTSIEEVQRISGGEGQAAKPAAPKPAAPAAQ
jgi:type II secretory ATPase GspE/PulE/Tfp pilus assembly ATPase PilB-like protein